MTYVIDGSDFTISTQQINNVSFATDHTLRLQGTTVTGDITTDTDRTGNVISEYYSSFNNIGTTTNRIKSFVTSDSSGSEINGNINSVSLRLKGQGILNIKGEMNVDKVSFEDNYTLMIASGNDFPATSIITTGMDNIGYIYYYGNHSIKANHGTSIVSDFKQIRFIGDSTNTSTVEIDAKIYSGLLEARNVNIVSDKDIDLSSIGSLLCYDGSIATQGTVYLPDSRAVYLENCTIKAAEIVFLGEEAICPAETGFTM
jgi:hypothetical protein